MFAWDFDKIFSLSLFKISWKLHLSYKYEPNSIMINQVFEYVCVPGGDLRKLDTSVCKPTDFFGILGKFLDLNML